MKTDKQVFAIFQSRPEWFFDLTQIKSPGDCRVRSIAFKEILVTTDGAIEPLLPEEPCYICEFQAQHDPLIYIRLVLEMALFQKQNPGRSVEGVIVFLDSGLDPKTEPWVRVVRSFTLAEQLAELERREPEHPMLAVFAPLVIVDDSELESSAATWYNRIVTNATDQVIRDTLVNTFVSWLEQRFVNKGKQEIEEMLVGSLPDLSETQSGKDLIAIGVQKGEAKGEAKGELTGRRESLLLILGTRLGEVPDEIKHSLLAIKSTAQFDALIQTALRIESIDQLNLK